MDKLIKKYPIRVNQWKLDYISETFTVEISDFGSGFHIIGIKDPWNRTFRSILPIANNENEVLYWQCHTTIEGKPIKCVVYND